MKDFSLNDMIRKLHEEHDIPESETGRDQPPEAQRILIADASDALRLLTEDLVRSWGYDPVTATNGADAWRILNEPNAPQLALLDWIMPKMEGIEVCKKIRASETLKSMYVIILSSKDEKDEIITGLDSGADDYMTKPFRQDELYARIRVGERVLRLQSSLIAHIKDLQEAFTEIDVLENIIPICMACHRIRDDSDYWHRLESYIQDHSSLRFSHGLCPACAKKLYPEEDPDATSSGALPTPSELQHTLEAFRIEKTRKKIDPSGASS